MTYQGFFRQTVQDDDVPPISSSLNSSSLHQQTYPSAYGDLRAAITQQQQFVSQYVQHAQLVQPAAVDPRRGGGVGSRTAVGYDDTSSLSPRTRVHQQQWREALGGAAGSEQHDKMISSRDIGGNDQVAGQPAVPRSFSGVGAARGGANDQQERTRAIHDAQPFFAASSRSSTPSVAAAPTPIPPYGTQQQQQQQQHHEQEDRRVGGWANEDRSATAQHQSLAASRIPHVDSQNDSPSDPLISTTAPSIPLAPPMAPIQRLPPTSPIPASAEEASPEVDWARAKQVPVGSQATFSSELDAQYHQHQRHHVHGSVVKHDQQQQQHASPRATTGALLSPENQTSSPFWMQQHVREQRRVVENSPLEALSNRHNAEQEARPAIARTGGTKLTVARRQAPAGGGRRTPSALSTSAVSQAVSRGGGSVLSATHIRSSLHDATTRMVALNQTLLQLTETHKMLADQSDSVRSQIAVAEAERHETESQYQSLCGSLKQAMEDLARQLKVKQDALNEARETNAKLRQQMQQTISDRAAAA